MGDKIHAEHHNPTVRVIVRGGVAEVIQKDKGVTVILIDYDNDPNGDRTVFHGCKQIGRKSRTRYSTRPLGAK